MDELIKTLIILLIDSWVIMYVMYIAAVTAEQSELPTA